MFHIGDIVITKDEDGHNDSWSFLGKEGIVKCKYKGRIGVRILGQANPISPEGVSYFKEEDLILKEEEALKEGEWIFNVGDKVIVDRVPNVYERYNIVGSEGTVSSVNLGKARSIGVKIEDKYSQSTSRLFWFKESDIHIKEVKSMEDKKLKGFKKVAVIEFGGKSYDYALYEDGTEYKEGDTVLVTDASRPVRIVSIKNVADCITTDHIHSEVKCKVDLSAFEKRVSDRKRAQELIDSMDRKIKEMDKIKTYELYAKDNPELAAMLEEYNKLNV